MTEIKNYEVDGRVLQVVLTYLEQKPYVEVVGMIQALQQSAVIKPPVGKRQRKKKDEKKDEPAKTE